MKVQPHMRKTAFEPSAFARKVARRVVFGSSTTVLILTGRRLPKVYPSTGSSGLIAAFFTLCNYQSRRRQPESSAADVCSLPIFLPSILLAQARPPVRWMHNKPETLSIPFHIRCLLCHNPFERLLGAPPRV